MTLKATRSSARHLAARTRRARAGLAACALGFAWAPLSMSVAVLSGPFENGSTPTAAGLAELRLAATVFELPVAAAAPPTKAPGKNRRNAPPAGEQDGGDQAPQGGAGHGEGGHGDGAAAHDGHHDKGIKLLGGATLEDPRTGIIILLLNFVVLLFVLEKVLFSNLRNGHVAHRNQVRADLDQATKAKAEAQALLAEVELRMKNLDASVDEILAAAKQRALTDRERILEQAVKDAAAIMQAATAAAEREAMLTRKTIEHEVVASAIARAEALLREKFGDAEQRRSVDAYVSELGVVDFKRVS